MKATVIESRHYRHNISGLTVSPYGALPWRGESDKANWSMVTTGFTIKHPDGTIGLGRKPFETAAEAQAWIDAHPNFPGMQQY
jgi:hypothetical protein